MANFNNIIKDIKSLKIQGANNIAKAGLQALKLDSSQKAIRKILSARPTEPTLRNAITFAKLTDTVTAMNYLVDSEKRAIEQGTSLIKSGQTIFTHCHSSTVLKTIKKAKEQKKNFQVFNTETRPRYQGRLTSQELIRAKIKNTHFVDSGVEEALEKSDIVLLGADMITPKAEVANKIGSEMVAKLARNKKIPVYILTSAWKYSTKQLKIEERDSKEVWNKKNKYLKIRNPAFELIQPEYITSIVSGLGIQKPKKLVKKIKKTYSWIK
jgi:ribose 1,5-bisphosphate isomerase